MKKNEDFKYTSVKDNPAVLGTLEGPCADITEGTRNGRKYSQELWEKAFANDIVKEQFEAGGLLGELCHPVDREETDLEKVAICMPAPPTKKDGKLWAKFHILDTPCGRILKTLCDYGYKIGISSRGTGDVYEDVDGESVDPDTYQLNAFDAVIVPAVKAARLEMVTESLHRKKTLKQALTESLEKANDKDKKIMEEALNTLKLDEAYDNPWLEISDVLDKCINGFGDDEEALGDFLQGVIGQCREIAEEKGLLIESVEDGGTEEDRLNINKEEPKEVVDDKSQEEESEENSLVAELKESLLNCQKLEKDNLSLQEQLSVCNAKEKKLEEEVSNYKLAVVNLSESAKKVKPLQTRLDKVLEENLNKDEIIKTNKKSLKLKENLVSSLKSDLETSNKSVEDLKVKINSLKEELQTNKQKLSSSQKVAIKYKDELTEAKSQLISAKANAYGISEKELSRKLGESYKLKEIDSICEDLRTYQEQVNKLPFRINSNTKVTAKPSENEYIMKGSNKLTDDDVSSLLRMID